MENMDDLKKELLAAVTAAADMKSLEEVRVSVLGKKGRITELMKSLGSLSIEEKKEKGRNLNILKSEVEQALDARKEELAAKELDAKLAAERIDVTLPVRPEQQGRIHPVSKIYEEVAAIFGEMGFEVAEGPDIEDQFHNFNALNMPANHPARQMQDTFYIPNPDSEDKDDSFVVRTHTSPVQIRTMENCRYALLRRAGLTALITMPPIPRCFIRSKGWLSTRQRPWLILRAACMIL